MWHYSWMLWENVWESSNKKSLLRSGEGKGFLDYFTHFYLWDSLDLSLRGHVLLYSICARVKHAITSWHWIKCKKGLKQETKSLWVIVTWALQLGEDCSKKLCLWPLVRSQPILQLRAAIHAPQVWEHHWQTACVRRSMLLKSVEIKENSNQRKVRASQDFQHPLYYFLTSSLVLNSASKVQDKTFEFSFSSQWNLVFWLFCFSVFLLIGLSFGNFN